MLTKAAFVWSKYSKNNNIVKYYCNLKKNFSIVLFYVLIIPVMAKLNFVMMWFLCWFAAQKTFLIINVENSCAAK